MKADRLLSALLLLQAHGKLTVRQLAERLEVSQRTAHRDMEALSAAGVPVVALRGANGGWQLDEAWRTEVPGLDEAELRALLMAQPRVLGDEHLAHSAERAFEKLLAAMPVAMRARAAFIQERLHVDTTGWSITPENLATLPTVQDAVSQNRRLTIRYRAANNELVERSLDPLGLVAKGSTWYLVARTPDGMRTYRVSRIEEASLLDAPCERPTDFDLAAYWKASTAELLGRRKYTVTLRADARAAEELSRWQYGVRCADASPDEEGRVLMRVPFEEEEHAAFVVRGLGPRVDVVEPTALRDRILAEAAELLRRAKH
ncbi:MAG: YafY family transcriptional regulator [Acidobacteria bacterium]|nr:YafY family transcriptional regulator [Acidobacteriota bacterium]